MSHLAAVIFMSYVILSTLNLNFRCRRIREGGLREFCNFICIKTSTDRFRPLIMKINNTPRTSFYFLGNHPRLSRTTSPYPPPVSLFRIPNVINWNGGWKGSHWISSIPFDSHGIRGFLFCNCTAETTTTGFCLSSFPILLLIAVGGQSKRRVATVFLTQFPIVKHRG